MSKKLFDNTKIVAFLILVLIYAIPSRYNSIKKSVVRILVAFYISDQFGIVFGIIALFVLIALDKLFFNDLFSKKTEGYNNPLMESDMINAIADNEDAIRKQLDVDDGSDIEPYGENRDMEMFDPTAEEPEIDEEIIETMSCGKREGMENKGKSKDLNKENAKKIKQLKKVLEKAEETVTRENLKMSIKEKKAVKKNGGENKKIKEEIINRAEKILAKKDSLPANIVKKAEEVILTALGEGFTNYTDIKDAEFELQRPKSARLM